MPELTKREHFALEIAKAMCNGNMKIKRDVDDLVKGAIRAADAMLAELEKPVEQPPVDAPEKEKGKGHDKDKDED
jgi:hypothetical protein